jgi:hypothetical protein
MRFYLLGSGKHLFQNQEKEKTIHGVVAAPSYDGCVEKRADSASQTRPIRFIVTPP